MKRKTLFVLCLLSALVMAGCSRKNTESAVPDSVTEENGGETGNVSQGGETEEVSDELTFRGEKLSGEDAVLFSEIKEAAGAEILLFDCADYDGDGNREAFAFAGVNNDGILEGQRWFAGAEGAAPLKNGGEAAEYLQDKRAVVETPENTAFWYTESDGGGATSSLLWGVSDKVPYESVLSGKGEAFTVTEDGTYILYQSSTDAREEGTGRTVKPCYFYYENGSFHEYGAMAVGQDSFLGLPGAAECFAPYEADGYWVRDIHIRGNGLVQLNLRKEDRNVNVTCAWKDGKLSKEEENDGIAGLLVGELASAEWHGPEGALQQLWEKRRAAEEADGIAVEMEPAQAAWYDLDGDGVPEEIRYTVRTGEDMYGADGMEVSIDGKTVWETDQAVSIGYQLLVVDLDRNDGKKELAVYGLEDSGGFSMLKFFAAEDGKLKELGDLREVSILGGLGNLYRIGVFDFDSGRMMRLPGDGSIEIWADTPVFAEGLGSYYVKLDFVFGSSGIAQTERQEYDMKVPLAGGEPYLYTAQQPIPFYSTREECLSGEPTFLAAPGEQLNCAALTPAAENQIYVKMRRAGTREEGWTVLSDTQVFAETPGWG